MSRFLSEAGGVTVRSVTLAAQVLRVTWIPQFGIQGLGLGDRDATALITVALAGVTAWLALETQRLARGARREIGVLDRQAATADRQLAEFKKQGTHRPLLEWEQWALDAVWEQGAEITGPKTGKQVRFNLGLKAINYGGAAFMTEAHVRGDRSIIFESPRKLTPTNREYLMRIGFDAVGGTPFRKAVVLEQHYRAWHFDEEFVAHVLIALASDWFDHNDPRPTVIPLQRPDHIDEDAARWTTLEFKNYDEDIARQRAEAGLILRQGGPASGG